MEVGRIETFWEIKPLSTMNCMTRLTTGTEAMTGTIVTILEVTRTQDVMETGRVLETVTDPVGGTVSVVRVGGV